MKIDSVLEEAANFLRKKKVDCKYSRCNRHKGLTYRCLRGGERCVTCLGCEVERILYDDAFVCGSTVVDKNGTELQVTDEVVSEIPELSEEDVEEFFRILNNLRDAFNEFRKEKIEMLNKLI